MTYPLSSEVNVGDATEAAQYNNLRTDALYLGADPSAAGTLRDLVYQLIGKVDLQRTSKTVITLQASSDDPCGVMIEGTIYSVTANVSVSLSSDSLATKGRYYLYAAALSSGAFSLGAGSAAPSGARIIGTFLWSGTGVIPGTVEDIRKYMQRQGTGDKKGAAGRLTLASGVPVPDGDITMGETLYFTPYDGNTIGLKVGSEWEEFEFAELSVSLSGLLREIPYDVVLSVDEDGLQLELSAWGSASARLTSIVYSDGVPVLTSDAGKRYLGTIALNASGYGEDSQAGRLLWNRNHQVPRPLLAKLPDTATSQGSANNWMPYGGDLPAEVRILIPMTETDLELTGVGISTTITESDVSYSRGIAIGIGLDMEMSSPYTGNSSCVPVFCVSYGNVPTCVTLRNSDASQRGYHRYTLAFYTNYTYKSSGLLFHSIINENPGLYGEIMG